MFRCYAIIFSSLFETLQQFGLAPHLNSCFKRFVYFCLEFSLVEEREFKVISNLVDNVKGKFKVAKIEYRSKKRR